MRIKSMLSAGEVFVTRHNDVETTPMQIFRGGDGGTVLRIGSNAYFFNKDGTYDGSEHQGNSATMAADITSSLEQAKKNRGRRPESSYYQSPSPGYMAEVKAWPSEGEEPEDDGEDREIYGLAHGKKEEPN